MSDPNEIAENVGEAVAVEIETAIENANETAERAAELNEHLVEAAIEGERGNRISAIERRLDEWQSNQEDSNQAIAALSLGMERLTGQMEALLSQQSTPAPPPTPNPQNEAGGPRESQEETEVAVEAPIAEEPAPPAPHVPKKKKHRWI